MTRIGESPARLEDARLLLGRGRFHDSVARPGQLWMRVVRSTAAHGRLGGIDTTAACALDGVTAVITAEDVDPALRIPVRQLAPGLDFTPYLQPPLAREYVRYVGEPVAAVLAEDPFVAEDAAELVAVKIDPLPVALDARAAADVTPPCWGGARCEVGTIDFSYGDVAGAFACAAHVVTLDLSIGRHTGTPLENRGLTAAYDDHTERLTVWGASKVPHANRRVLAGMLGISEHSVHMPESDVGGSFGIRGEFYPEDLLVPLLAIRTGRPVTWTEDRAEHLVAANHAREQDHHIELAFDAEYRLLALRDEGWMDTGGYIRTHGAVVAVLTAAMMSGPYRLPSCSSRVHIVTTNKTPVGTFRAPGRFQNNAVREHALDVAAAQLGVDPIELRRRNLLTASELPHRRPTDIFGAPMLLDSADHLAHFDKACAELGYDGWREDAARARASGRLVGTGCAAILEKAGLGHDTAVVEVDATGSIRVAMGGTTVGQGIQTIMAQIAADPFDVPVHDVTVSLSDTDILHEGGGSFASRSTVVGGTAVRMAAELAVTKARRIAAALMNVGVYDIKIDGGAFVAVGTCSALSLAEVARAALQPRFVVTGDEPGLIGRATFVAGAMTYPVGAHFAMVEVDPATGVVRVLRYGLGYEIGRAINPALVHGQLLGGLVQGIGGALWEELRYDADGRPLVTDLGGYRWPRATDVPTVTVMLFEDAPAPGNPLGARGAGEGGTAGVGAAVANAVRDAIGLPGGVKALPLHPHRVRALCRSIERAAPQT